TLPDEPPEIAVAASQPNAAELASRVGDALIAVAPDEELVKTFGKDKPRYGQLHVCYAESEAQARRTAHELWPNAAMGGALGQELATTEHYETVAEDDVAEEVVCGPDPQKYLDAIK